ncbi:hypothetical protein F2Q70_00016339 [Brassica cretica]|uniref:Uncharacterized protein n=1 Tax=Brassica cretica TaxID=69181 RepID=A0A8S9HTK2_BRACR|nr:hypothetical protein F2Q70_00016339 [Brassica cretica]
MKEETSLQRGEGEPLSVTDAARAHVGGNLARISEAKRYETSSARSFSFKLIVTKRDRVLFLNELRPPPRPKTQDPNPSPGRAEPSRPDGGGGARVGSLSLSPSRLHPCST